MIDNIAAENIVINAEAISHEMRRSQSRYRFPMKVLHCQDMKHKMVLSWRHLFYSANRAMK